MQDKVKERGSTYGDDEAAMQAYLREGEGRAHALGNRGPIRFTSDGVLHPDIVDSYSRCGFYIFESVLGTAELSELEADFQAILENLPMRQNAPVDAHGRPALGFGLQSQTLRWSKPLGDPLGGTDLFQGRHATRMYEPSAAEDAPEEVVYLIIGSLQFSDAAVRLYGHPQLLRVAASVNGDDFVPFNEAIFLKAPGLGASVSWHQDGATHWGREDWDEGSHGFNFMAQLYGSTAANGVWVIPGSHRSGKADIVKLVEAAGSERLPDAAPIICKPGDVAMTNRQAVHGSFANVSPDWRVTFNFGFHRRRSVLGMPAPNAGASIHDAQKIRQRARAIGYGIEARHQRYPEETAFVYQPHATAGGTYGWDPAARASLKDYNLLDLAI